MKNKYLVLCVLLVLAAFAATVLLYGRLPARIPTHWDGAGTPDAWHPRRWIFVQVGMMALVTALWTVLPRLSPHNFAVDSFRATWWQTGFIAVAMLAYIQGVMLWGGVAQGLDVGRALMGGISIFICLLGNVMGKVRRNFWLGIRTPWTLASERVWYATHRLAAKWMFGTGLLAFAVIVAGLAQQAAFGLILAGVLVPAAWSLVYYKRLERGGGLQA